MKFRFKNLGPIKQADLELGDLTIIAGRNNTGKTYLAYALYGFLKRWEWSPKTIVDLSREEGLRYVGSLAAAAAHKGHTAIRADRHELEKRRSVIARTMACRFSKSELAQVFSTERGRFEGASVEFSSLLLEDLPPAELRDPSGNHYAVIGERGQQRFDKQAAKARPGQPVWTKPHRGITVSAFLGPTVPLACLVGT